MVNDKVRKEKAQRKQEEVEVKERLDWINERYGRVPLVVEMMAKRPDIFLPYFEFSRLALFEPKNLDRRTLELATIAAGSALASEHCLGIHLEQAHNAGATDDEIMEALLLGAYMALTKSQAVAFRMFIQMTDSRKGKTP